MSEPFEPPVPARGAALRHFGPRLPVCLLVCLALLGLLALSGCGIVIDDRAWDIGPAHDGSTDGATDGGVDGDGGAAPQDWPYDHAPEDCPELADDPPQPGDRPPGDPSCDGVSHFYCGENPQDPCCGGGSGGGSNGGDDGRNPGSSGGSGGGSGSGSGGGRPPDPRF